MFQVFDDLDLFVCAVAEASNEFASTTRFRAAGVVIDGDHGSIDGEISLDGMRGAIGLAPVEDGPSGR